MKSKSDEPTSTQHATTQPSTHEAAPSTTHASRQELRSVRVGPDMVHVLSVTQPELPAWVTAAQRELIEAVAAGLSNAEIAERRGTSVKTVANQLALLFERFDVHGRGELMRRVWRLP